MIDPSAHDLAAYLNNSATNTVHSYSEVAQDDPPKLGNTARWQPTERENEYETHIGITVYAESEEAPRKIMLVLEEHVQLF
jgi:hypothetical protein